MLAACLLYVGTLWVSLDAQHSGRQADVAQWIDASGYEQLPIVVAQPNPFLGLAQYAPPHVASRLVFLGDTTEAQRYLRQDTAERGFTDLAPWFPRTIMTYDQLRAGHREVLVFADWSDFGIRNWVVSRLLDDGARFELVGRNRDAQLFYVRLPAAATRSRIANPAM
jgi:hypothetical protein